MSAAIQTSVRRPFHPRGGSAAPTRRHTFASDALHRLALLAGLRCPNCGANCVFDGTRLRCGSGAECAYAWRDPDSAEDDIYCGIT